MLARVLKISSLHCCDFALVWQLSFFFSRLFSNFLSICAGRMTAVIQQKHCMQQRYYFCQRCRQRWRAARSENWKGPLHWPSSFKLALQASSSCNSRLQPLTKQDKARTNPSPWPSLDLKELYKEEGSYKACFEVFLPACILTEQVFPRVCRAPLHISNSSKAADLFLHRRKPNHSYLDATCKAVLAAFSTSVPYSRPAI